MLKLRLGFRAYRATPATLGSVSEPKPKTPT